MWAAIINLLLGAWLTAAPDVLSYDDPMATNDQIVGPLIASFSAMAIWQVLRPLRRVALILALWMLIAPWVLGASWPITAQAVILGIAVAGLSLVRGKLDKPYAGGWSVLWQEDPYRVGHSP